MNELLSPELVRKLVGVIDLKDHQAVHAVAGNRDQYHPVAMCDGDPLRLAKHYRQLGIQAIYVADLDAILGGPIQSTWIERICDLVATDGLLLMDIGWTGNESVETCDSMHAVANRFTNVRIIAATESMQTSRAIGRLADIVSPANVLLGLDYRDQQILGPLPASDWIEKGLANRISGAVVLDLMSIGGAAGARTVEICRDIRKRAADWLLLSGGGIRNATDANALIDAGCDWCLVASALHGIL